jgi:hypothetical protein
VAFDALSLLFTTVISPVFGVASSNRPGFARS